MTNWKSITDYFLNMINHPRYGTHAREMYKLCLVLREEPELNMVHIEADYLYLTLSVEGIAGQVVVSNESPEHYAISLEHPQKCQSSHENNIALAVITPLIFYFLGRLQDSMAAYH